MARRRSGPVAPGREVLRRRGATGPTRVVAGPEEDVGIGACGTRRCVALAAVVATTSWPPMLTCTPAAGPPRRQQVTVGEGAVWVGGARVRDRVDVVTVERCREKPTAVASCTARRCRPIRDGHRPRSRRLGCSSVAQVDEARVRRGQLHRARHVGLRARDPARRRTWPPASGAAPSSAPDLAVGCSSGRADLRVVVAVPRCGAVGLTAASLAGSEGCVGTGPRRCRLGVTSPTSACLVTERDEVASRTAPSLAPQACAR